VEQQDVERIARATLKDLGVFGADLTVARVEGQPGTFRIDVHERHATVPLSINCGKGTSPQWVREQIFEQYRARG
jgi:uncharacterized protein (UPF0128 family)